jgi:crossover junction endodeoxyribonuclease RusA
MTNTPHARIVVIGRPAPQGSKAYKGQSKKGHAILVESSKYVAPWREAVKIVAYQKRMHLGTAFDGPLIARMVFTIAKPKNALKRTRTYPATKPDLSKLIRSTEDALTDAGLIADDARIIEYSRVAKVYPKEDEEALDVPGVVIDLSSVHFDVFSTSRGVP